MIHEVIEQAYKAEYGLEIAEQSCLTFLPFIHADRRSKFTPVGVFSDERYHIVHGNDASVEGLTRRVKQQIQLEMKLVRLAKTAGEHANSFYDWQGFMEGAALSGVDAAGAIAQAIKGGILG